MTIPDSTALCPDCGANVDGDDHSWEQCVRNLKTQLEEARDRDPKPQPSPAPSPSTSDEPWYDRRREASYAVRTSMMAYFRWQVDGDWDTFVSFVDGWRKTIESDALPEDSALLKDAYLLEEVKRRAKACVHADAACQLVRLVNDVTDADAPWRGWRCEKHGWAGAGKHPQCPEFTRASIGAVP